MSTLVMVEVDALTGDAVERPFSEEEATQRKAEQAAVAAEQAEREAQQATAQSARRKIAEASGLTPEEMAALGF